MVEELEAPPVPPAVDWERPQEVEAPPIPAAVAGEAIEPEPSEPWLQAEQDSDPGREPEVAHEPEPEPAPEPLVAADESEAEPEPEPGQEVEALPAPALPLTGDGEKLAADPVPSAQSTQVTRPPGPRQIHDAALAGRHLSRQWNT